ncbi:MAG: hypothetical protein V3V20_05195, partial [Algisphaera sp.]
VLTSVFALTRNGQVISGKRFYAKTQRRQDAKEAKKAKKAKKASKNTFALWYACDIQGQVERLFLK